MQKYFKGDGFDYMHQFIDNKKKVDAIIIDPPYNKTKGMKLQGAKHNHDWDKEIDVWIFFSLAFLITNTIIVFGQQPTLSKWIEAAHTEFKEELIWIKNNCAQGFHADKMHLKFFENIVVFQKGKGTFNLNQNFQFIDKDKFPCRAYVQKVMNFLKTPRTHIHKKMGHRKLEFFLFYRGTLFNLPPKKLYDEFVTQFELDKQSWNLNFEQLKMLFQKEKSINIKLNNSFSTAKTNVLYFDKDAGNYHPTQKPVKLMEYLIKTYTNEKDTVLDIFMGSGTTLLAAKNTNRIGYGSEINDKFFNIAMQRLKEK